MATLTRTSSYSGRFTWTIHDEVIRLRQWATDTVYELPRGSEVGSSECTVGAGRGCQIQLDDRWASRHHALLSYEEGFWNVADLESRNGVKIDGVRLRKARLEPGMEVQIGRTTLLAESLRSIGLHCYLGRILGWSERQREAVDAAMSRVRQAHRDRAPIVLRGEGELVAVAQELHGHVFGPNAPFIMCDPYRHTGRASARAPANVEEATAALTAAHGGTLCFRSDKPPREMEALLRSARAARASSVQVMICDEGRRRLVLDDAEIIEIPSLGKRSRPEQSHVVTEYAADAARALGVKQTLTGADQAWVLQHCGSSFSEIGKGTRRLLALRVEGTLAGAARRLGMSHPALRRWFADRSLAGLGAEDEGTATAELDDERE